MHLTATNQDGDGTDGIPGVFFDRDSNGPYLWVEFIPNRKAGQAWNELIYLSDNKWYHIQLDQKIIGQSGQFTVTIDGEVKWTVENEPEQFKNVIWYQSDPWYESIAGKADIRGLTLTSMGTTIAPDL